MAVAREVPQEPGLDTEEERMGEVENRSTGNIKMEAQLSRMENKED